jgi:hypothetical protein
MNMDLEWGEIIKEYPHLLEEMDGSDEGSYLEVFYEILIWPKNNNY